MIEEVTRQELEQELHRKIKLKEGSGKEQSHLDETEGVSEPTLMIGEKTEEEKYQFFVSDQTEKFTAFATSILPNDVKETRKVDIEKY